LRLNRPANHNAIDVELRDALCDALELGAADDMIETISLTGNGRCFSTGGDLGEFGTVSDPSTAHWIRSLRLPARHALAVRNKLSVAINGPAIGAGIEIAAFASKITASRSAWFQLPELRYGLIPGAGGTVSVARRIGRHRTVELILSMRRLAAVTALEWGLVDAVTA
jgi:enoyl-CoA hydratase/carnithine racemase